MRDEKIHEIGLENDRYPTATFVLFDPITLPASVLSDHVVHVSATGVFNIHGTSKRETVPLEMSLSSSTIQAVGSLTFPWSEFNMTAPSVGGFVNVTNKATMESTCASSASKQARVACYPPASSFISRHA